ncbi:MAG: hypothetical protein M1819_000127 [Sarea resinae]|nr:MAG: hypothetical protein M1819_000127 [Sarea resinae]
MTSDARVAGDPFADPSDSDQQRDVLVALESTLSVGRDVSLSLGTDSLIVLDESLVGADRGLCCGIIPRAPKTTYAVPLYNVLWAELTEFDLTIHYARSQSQDSVRVAFINYSIEKTERARASAWIARLLDRAYGEAQREKRIKVLINPFGGKGAAQRNYVRDIEPILAAAHCTIDVEQTKYQGHAVDIAEKLDIDAYDVIACCSGDGVPHEVFNGLAKKGDARKALSKIAVVQLPCGSGNAMSLNLNGTISPSIAGHCLVKGLRTPLDLVSITQGDRRTLSFLSQSVGIVAESDLGTDNIRWMGSARFTVGFLVRLLRDSLYPCDIAVGVEIADKPSIKEHYEREVQKRTVAKNRRETPAVIEESASTASNDSNSLPPLRFGTINDSLPKSWNMVPYDNLGNFYAGNMAYMSSDANFFPAALPDDGYQDLVCIDGDISRAAALRAMLAVEKGTFFNLPYVGYRKITGYRIIPKAQGDGYISIDGERIPFKPFQAEVHRGLGTVLSKNGQIYEAMGPP